MKISNFLLGMIVVGMFVSILGIYYSDIAVQYSKDFDNSTFAGYNQLSTINEDLREMNTTLQGLSTESGITDILGGFLSSGFRAVKATFSSFDAFFSMATTVTQSTTPIGNVVTFFANHLVLIVMVLFFFAVITIIVGRDV